MPFPRLGTYHSLRSDGTQLKSGGVLQADRIAKLARWDDVIIDVGSVNANNYDILTALRQANPKIRIWGYIVLNTFSSPQTFQIGLNTLVPANNGVLLGLPSGTWTDVGGYTNINLARTQCVDAMVMYFKPFLASYDGIFLDICLPTISASQTDINFSGMGYANMTEFSNAWTVGATRLINSLALTGKPIITNFGNVGFPTANGHMIEDFYAQNGGTWISNMNGLFNEVHASPKGSFICTGNQFIDSSLPPTLANQKANRFGLGSACLVGDFHSFWRGEGDTTWCLNRLDFWFPEYDDNGSQRYWLGEPTGAAALQGDGTWKRAFTGGYVFVNPTATPISVSVPEHCRNVSNDVQGKRFLIPATDSLFLRFHPYKPGRPNR